MKFKANKIYIDCQSKIRKKPGGSIFDQLRHSRTDQWPWSREKDENGNDKPNKVTDGPWTQEKDPVTPPNFGHGMLFHSFDGKLLIAIHSHKSINGRTVRIPHLFEVDLSGDKLIVGNLYKPRPN